jgi:hypothetical protein
MRNWSKALETAFEASLKNGGYPGCVGNRAEKDSVCNSQAVTQTRSGSYPRAAIGNRKIPQKLTLERSVTNVTGVTDVFSDVAFEERAALIEHGADVARDWAEGFARLDLAAPPPDFSDDRWRTVVNDGGRFLDRWAQEAARLGWQAADVFGVHPIAPSARFDAMGLVPIIRGGDVTSINERSATIRSPGGQFLIYMRRPSGRAVCLWEIGAGS